MKEKWDKFVASVRGVWEQLLLKLKNLTSGQKLTDIKLSKKALWGGAAAIAVVVVVWFIFPRQPENAGITLADTTTLYRGDFTDSVTSTGRVESSNARYIYSTLSYPVEEIFVDVGDVVAEGDLLCKLDGSSLEDQIASKETALSESQEASAQSVKTAQDSYDAAYDALENGENSSLVSADSSVATAYENWKKAKKTYEDYEETLDDGLNTTLVTQDAAVEDARVAYESAQNDYLLAKSEADAAKALLDSYVPTAEDDSAAGEQLSQAQADYDAALQSVSEKQAALDAATAALEQAGSSDTDPETLASLQTARDQADQAFKEADAAAREAQQQLETLKSQQQSADPGEDETYQQLLADYTAKLEVQQQAESRMQSADEKYDSAVLARDAAYRSADNTLADYALAKDNARRAYLRAKEAYEAAEASAETSLQSSYNSLESSRINAGTASEELAIDQLRDDLANTEIVATADGTVTAVYATVGVNGQGLLFVIEDTGSLIVKTTVDEYDIVSIQPGQAVDIIPDALDTQSFEGQVLSIAPTAEKDSTGKTDDSSDILYEVKIAITSQNTPLLIGMSVEAEYILERQSDVFTVPEEAVYTGRNGETCVMVLTEAGRDQYKVEELTVAAGAENGMDVIVEGDSLADGIIVVNDPESYMAMLGREITLSQSGGRNASDGSSNQGMMPFGG